MVWATKEREGPPSRPSDALPWVPRLVKLLLYGEPSGLAPAFFFFNASVLVCHLLCQSCIVLLQMCNLLLAFALLFLQLLPSFLIIDPNQFNR